MNNNFKIFIIASALVVGVYFYTKKKKVEPVLADVEDEESLPSKIFTTPVVKPNWDKILKLGSKGIEVRVLQKALRQLDVDGDFGKTTEKRLKKVTGFNQISINQYNDFIKNKPKLVQKVKVAPKVVKAKPITPPPAPPTSFTSGLI
jgi:hypothetical protein